MQRCIVSSEAFGGILQPCIVSSEAFGGILQRCIVSSEAYGGIVQRCITFPNIYGELDTKRAALKSLSGQPSLIVEKNKNSGLILFRRPEPYRD